MLGDPFQEGCALTDINHTKSQRTENLTAAELAIKQQQLVAGWEQFGSVTVQGVPGSHITMITEPYVQELAERLVDLFEANGNRNGGVTQA